MNLRDKLKLKQDEKKTKEIDWSTIKLNWENSISKLFTQIKEWLNDLYEEGLIQFNDENKITITEEYMGVYSVPILEINLDDIVVLLEPVARNIVGAKGRIDFYRRGEESRGVMLILNISENTSDSWSLVEKNKRTSEILLTKELFISRLNSWVD